MIFNVINCFVFYYLINYFMMNWFLYKYFKSYLSKRFTLLIRTAQNRFSFVEFVCLTCCKVFFLIYVKFNYSHKYFISFCYGYLKITLSICLSNNFYIKNILKF